MERKTAWNEYKKKDMKKLEKLNAGYRAFLDNGKTERECVKESVRQAEEAGYVNLDTYVKENRALKPGDKVYAVCMKKAIALFQIGTRPLTEGMNILGAHIDSPRLDVKQNPLYEDNGFTYLDTHYYGGIKKWQWVTLPLAIHGVVAKKNGEVVDVVIGEDDNDPVFCVTDLLIHLSREQQTKPANTVVEGENLDLLIGSQPLEGTEKEAVKAMTLKLLNDKYGIEEEDFLSAELEIVPAGKARELGMDASMILAYGQDDRVCAYTSLVAMLEVEAPEKTSCCLLVDKEEIGSVGAPVCSLISSRTPWQSCLHLQAREQNWPFEDALLPPECSLLMSAQHLIRYMQQHLRRKMQPSSEKVSSSTNLPVPAEKAVPTMPMQSMSEHSALFSMMPK